jgi:hypothetical protein
VIFEEKVCFWIWFKINCNKYFVKWLSQQYTSIHIVPKCSICNCEIQSKSEIHLSYHYFTERYIYNFVRCRVGFGKCEILSERM